MSTFIKNTAALLIVILLTQFNSSNTNGQSSTTTDEENKQITENGFSVGLILGITKSLNSFNRFY